MNTILWNDFRNSIKNYLHYKELDAFIKTIIEKEKPHQIILFGSLTQNRYHYESDADLFVILDQVIDIPSMKKKLLSYSPFDDETIDPFPYSAEEFNELAKNQGLFIYHSLKKSVLIYERTI